jgi:GTP-binding protein HflX
VRDIAHPDTLAQSNDVHEVMRQLVVDFTHGDRLIEVLNKIDLLDPAARAAVLDRTDGEGAPAIGVSALTGEGLPALLALVEDRLNRDRGRYQIALPASDGALMAWAYRSLEVLGRVDDEERVLLTVRVPDKALDHFRLKAGAYIVDPAN